MGLFDKIFNPIKTLKVLNAYFSTFTAYSPVFVDRAGGIYEAETTRSAVHAFAVQCSKLKPHITGASNKALEKKLQLRMNPWQTMSQFLYRTATILEVENNVFLVPVLNRNDKTVGAFAVLPSLCEIVEDSGGNLYLRYQFSTGQFAAVEYERCAILTQRQFRDDFFGESNAPLAPILDLIDIQNQGIQEGIKQAASVRFMAKLGQSIRDEDLKKEQRRFRELNLSSENNGGVLIYDAKYSDVKQIDSKPFVIDADQMKLINDNVYSYFGTNEKILRNEWNEAEWNAYYEGKVEPFALWLSLALTSMFYSEREIELGNTITFSANRLQFASTAVKLSTIVQLFDRGMLNRNEGREIMQMAPIPGKEGEIYYIRGEYMTSESKIEMPAKKENEDE